MTQGGAIGNLHGAWLHVIIKITVLDQDPKLKVNNYVWVFVDLLTFSFKYLELITSEYINSCAVRKSFSILNYCNCCTYLG